METFKALHISDIHNDFDCWDRFDYIQEHYPNERLFLTGDMTHDGWEWQYRLVSEMPDSPAYYPVPGNHDVLALGIWKFKHTLDEFDDTFKTRFDQSRKPSIKVFRESRVVLISLNSNPGKWGWRNFARGKIGKEQLLHLDIILSDYNKWTRIVQLHHHPIMRHMLMELKDARKLRAIIKGRCEVLLCGHKHVQEFMDIPGIPLAHAAGAMYRETEALEVTVTDGVVSHAYVPII